MSLARAIRRGAALKARFGVNGSQYDVRSLGTAVAVPDGTDAMATPLPPRDGASTPFANQNRAGQGQTQQVGNWKRPAAGAVFEIVDRTWRRSPTSPSRACRAGSPTAARPRSPPPAA